MTYSFNHLIHMSDDIGLFEHAEYDQPRREHGYCVDDVARGLVVISREPNPSPALERLAEVYLRFLEDAAGGDGRFRNRQDTAGRWSGELSVEDCWGRALWGLGSVVARMPSLRARANILFHLSARLRSSNLHSMLFAGLGAAEVLSVYPQHVATKALMRSAAYRIHVPARDRTWPWPESRLRYANAAIPQVLLLAGAALDEPRWQLDGIRLLRWLVETETRDGHLSMTPVGGWRAGEPRPGFDQQPIEVAALADACATAFAQTGDREWLDTLQLCGAWFDGSNDTGVPMADRARGAGYDGLQSQGRNENQGAESTLAMLTTAQLLARLPVRA